ncbi:MAG: Bax inhibitor-1/YccA family protein [Spongiibacteraceae bacterium]|jgi:modulator of FtsH protease|nr:Bax inhibitor-1/YccA family protein [Spongiibacteraceae bacterium]
MQQPQAIDRRQAGVSVASSAATAKVLKNTYLLLAMTLAFSAFTAMLARSLPPLNPWLFLIGAYGLMFLTHKLANSAWGLVSVFAFTGFFGFALGPILNAYLQSSAGTAILTQALGGTAIAFAALSGYALVSRKDFSFLSGFIVIGFVVLMLGVVAGLFLNIPALSLALSAGFILFASAAILYQTSAIIHGGERNYILATIGLYVSIYNIFISLLNLLTAFGGDD